MNINVDLLNQLPNLIISNTWTVYYSIATTIGMFFLLEEKGVDGWRSLIPIYGTYKIYQTFLGVGAFILEVVAIIGFIFGIFQVGIGSSTESEGAAILLMGVLLIIVSIIVLVILDIVLNVAISHSFGKRGLFTFGMIFFTPFFRLALAWENRKELR